MLIVSFELVQNTVVHDSDPYCWEYKIYPPYNFPYYQLWWLSSLDRQFLIE